MVTVASLDGLQAQPKWEIPGGTVMPSKSFAQTVDSPELLPKRNWQNDSVLTGRSTNVDAPISPSTKSERAQFEEISSKNKWEASKTAEFKTSLPYRNALRPETLEIKGVLSTFGAFLGKQLRSGTSVSQERD